MPYSTQYFKPEIRSYILSNFSLGARILDVGAGCGTYSDLLRSAGYTNIDCVEAHEDYIERFGLAEKYRKIYVGDVTNLEINYSSYDLIILGDVLEHLSVDSAQILLTQLESQVIVAVPFNSAQGAAFGNKYEIHLQADLSFLNFFQRYRDFRPLCLRFDYGVFIKGHSTKIYIESGEQPLPDGWRAYLEENFPDLTFVGAPEKITDQKRKMNHEITLVTGIWDLGRDQLSGHFKRTYCEYLEKFCLLLAADVPMYIFADQADEDLIWAHRNKANTVFHGMSLSELKDWFEFTDKTNQIRMSTNWLNQARWLRDSPQGALEGYNPLVMSKMFMLNNVTIWNPFGSEYFFWIDAGIANTVSPGYFTNDRVLERLPKFIADTSRDFVFLTFPYETGDEIHGFNRRSMASYANVSDVKQVCRGGFFGGKKDRINAINGLYYGFLKKTLEDGFMGTEENILSIVAYNNPTLTTQFMLGADGLIWPFFENLKKQRKHTPSSRLDSIMYVITYNCPGQLEALFKSMNAYDKNILLTRQKYLLDNSTDEGTSERYKQLCHDFGFEHIKRNNLGICGGRQFIAEHFDKTDYEYMTFFEDDMLFCTNGSVCKNGFSRLADHLISKAIQIMDQEDLDYLKLNFTEFYGDNSAQWSWYNVPQSVRSEHWPHYDKLPSIGLDPSAPRVAYRQIKCFQGIPYALGDVYYCNWPQIVSKRGNKKIFIDTKWKHPYEQTWMSHAFQLTVRGDLKTGVLLMTPTEHQRTSFYNSGDRKEH